MKQKEAWSLKYYYDLLKDFSESKNIKDKIKLKVKRNSPNQHWLEGFEFAMKITLDPSENGFIRWNGSEYLDQEINKEVETPILDEKYMVNMNQPN